MAETDVDVAIMGAGPYGLAAAAHLRRAGVGAHVLGDPMSFWRQMPKGMLLRSNWTATCIAEHTGPLSLDTYCACTGADVPRPVPLQQFIDYGTWVADQVAPDVDRRTVRSLDAADHGFRLLLTSGEALRARRVVIAAGIAPFAFRPTVTRRLPAELASHTADHADLSTFAGRRVLVVGGGQSALESAALLTESGAQAEVVARADHLTWLHGGRYHRMLGRLAPVVYAPTDVGPMGLSRLVAVPELFQRLPRSAQGRIAHRCIRPAGAQWLQPRLADVPVVLGTVVTSVRPLGDGVLVGLSDGTTRTVDHILCGTGYRVDVSAYPFLSPDLATRIRQVGGYPVLGAGMESSVPGLHVIGAPAARSFGPIMRFVAGGWYTGQELVAAITGVRRPAPAGGDAAARRGRPAARRPDAA